MIMMSKSTIISWAVIIVIVVAILIAFFNNRPEPQVVVQSINCEEKMPPLVSDYPDFFDDVEQAVSWCKICEKNNSIPTISVQGAFCNPITTDNINRCVDSDECQGYCVGVNENSTTGRCSDTQYVLGCFYEMANGQAIKICK